MSDAAQETTFGTPVAPTPSGGWTPTGTPDNTPRPGVNPYVAKLANQLLWHMLPGSLVTPTELAQHIFDELLTPKNKRIHELSGKLQHAEAQIARLGKVLNRHNEGEWHQEKETAIDCAVRLFSPVPDQTPVRDKP